MTHLLHICCGPCATAVVPFWREREAEVVGFFYNPNIQPDMEFRRRLTGVRDLAEVSGLPVIEDVGGAVENWPPPVDDPSGSRCTDCIRLRLERTAAESIELGCDAFSTTLAISPWQDHAAIAAEGARAAATFGVRFLYEDLRPLYPESRRVSRELGLYRQKYCGCLASKSERERRPGATGRPCG